VRTVVVDANVFVSFFIERHEAQRAAARELLQSAEDGEIAGIVPQSVVFEVAYVLQSQYAVAGDRLATIIRAVTSFPGVQLVDECPWKRVLEIWPDPLSSLADAATFDRKLANRLESFGLAAYW
jgi:predicted nucleic acid-binding protein